jgi:anaerobic magnesium-protoporphyrin IX monomethyl ester cyclase
MPGKTKEQSSRFSPPIFSKKNSGMFKVALIALNINEETYAQLAMPIGLCYLASYVRKYLTDCPIEFVIFDGTVKCEEIEADLVGISSMSRYIPKAIALAEGIKRRGPIPVILGGPHITALPHTLDTAFDAAVLDEGEETFLELCRIAISSRALPASTLAGVKGIAFHKGSEVIITPPRPYIDPIERIPSPERSLWPMKDRIKWVSSSRGCPFACAFCGLAKSVYRKFPAPYVVNELIQMKDTYNIKAITFQDDLFTADKKRLREIVELIESHSLQKELSFMVSLRSDLIDEPTLELLKRMNVKNIFMGIESGSEKVLSFLKSNTAKVTDMQRAIDLCHDYDIQIEGSFIIGSPMEESSDLKATYDFICDNYGAGKLDMVAIYLLTPFPGTKVWEYAKSRGLVDELMDWSRLNLFTIIDFKPEASIYLNEKIPLDEFEYYVNIFKKLLFLVNQKGIERMKKNILDPMDVHY